MKNLLNESNKKNEAKLRETIKEYCINNAARFDPYSVSKVMRYLYNYNDGSESAVKVYETLGMQFLTNLKERIESIKEMSFDDPLIDLHIKDIVDIVRVYSIYSKHEKYLFVPQLFLEETSG